MEHFILGCQSGRGSQGLGPLFCVRGLQRARELPSSAPPGERSLIQVKLLAAWQNVHSGKEERGKSVLMNLSRPFKLNVVVALTLSFFFFFPFFFYHSLQISSSLTGKSNVFI